MPLTILWYFFQGMVFVLRSQFRLVEYVRRCKLMQGNTYISKDILSAYLCCMYGRRSWTNSVLKVRLNLLESICIYDVYISLLVK